MDYQFLAGILLFQGLSPDVLPDLLAGLGAGTRFYPRGEAVLRTGDRTGRLGLVLSGGVNIENHDAWGNGPSWTMLPPARSLRRPTPVSQGNH